MCFLAWLCCTGCLYVGGGGAAIRQVPCFQCRVGSCGFFLLIWELQWSFRVINGKLQRPGDVRRWASSNLAQIDVGHEQETIFRCKVGCVICGGNELIWKKCSLLQEWKPLSAGWMVLRKLERLTGQGRAQGLRVFIICVGYDKKIWEVLDLTKHEARLLQLVWGWTCDCKVRRSLAANRMGCGKSTKRCLHGLQDLMEKAARQWLVVRGSCTTKWNLHLISFDAGLFIEDFYISLKRGSRWPIECCRSSDWKQTFGPIASWHASRVDLAEELLICCRQFGDSDGAYLFGLSQALGISPLFLTPSLCKHCKVQQQKNCCCEACETARGGILSHDQVLISENPIAKIHEMLPPNIKILLTKNLPCPQVHSWMID